MKEEFTKETGERERMIEKAGNALEHAFDFMEDAFGAVSYTHLHTRQEN